jgi:hypothetical protein
VLQHLAPHSDRTQDALQPLRAGGDEKKVSLPVVEKADAARAGAPAAGRERVWRYVADILGHRVTWLAEMKAERMPG